MENKENIKFSDWKRKEYFLVFLYTIISLQFYQYVGFGITIEKLTLCIMVPIMFVLCRKTFMLHVGNKLFLLMRWLVIQIALSIIFAYIFWDQSILHGYRVAAPEFALLFYFYLYKRKPSLRSLEKYIIIFGMLYCLLWLYAFSQIPTRVFGIAELGDINQELKRGMIRVNFIGRGFLILSYFLVLNRAYTLKKKIYFVASVVFYIFIIVQLTRQLIFLTGLVTVIYIFKKSKRTLFMAITAILLLFVAGQNIKINPDSILGSLIDLTEKDMKDNSQGEENIRITQYRYFFTEWSPNIIADIVGNGAPHWESSYGKFYGKLNTQKGFFLDDIGYGRMKVVTGYIGLVLWLILFIRCCFVKMPEHLMYAWMFMVFFLLSNAMASWYAFADFQLAMCISVYLMTFYGMTPIHENIKTQKTMLLK